MLNELNYRYWEIFIEGEISDLKKISLVRYILHPSFTPQVVESTSAEEKFRYGAMGYDSFRLKVEIFLKGKESNQPITREYFLDINEPNSKGMEI